MTQEQYNACRMALEMLGEALNGRWAAEFAEVTWSDEVNKSTDQATKAWRTLQANWFELREDVRGVADASL